MVTKPVDSVDAARERWLTASKEASKLAAQMYHPGSGYGDPEARLAAEHQLESARAEAERLHKEYSDLDRIRVDGEILQLQRSQKHATWASFFVAAAVAFATIVQIALEIVR